MWPSRSGYFRVTWVSQKEAGEQLNCSSELAAASWLFMPLMCDALGQRHAFTFQRPHFLQGGLLPLCNFCAIFGPEFTES